MKLIELKTWINELPEEFMEFDVVNGEFKTGEDENTYYRFDEPVTTVAVDEENNEILILNQYPEDEPTD